MLFAVGNGWALAVRLFHAGSGVGLLGLAPAKTRIAQRSLPRRRWRSGPALVLAVAVVVTVASGIAHALGRQGAVAGLSVMQLHVGAALAAVALGAWHIRTRPQRLTADVGRRAVLRVGLLGLAGVGAARALDGLQPVVSSVARRQSSGSIAAPREDGPVPTTWLFDHVPDIDATTWSLTLVDLRGHRQRLSYAELARFTDERRAVLDCTNGWYADATWRGAGLTRLLPSAEGARSIVVVSATGYRRRLPLRDADRALVATRLNGEVLSADHGYPARLVVPGRRGFWWVKWVTHLALEATPWWWQPPFPPR